MHTLSNGVEIEYETFGDPTDPALLMVMGLGAQLIAWDVEFAASLVDRGFFVIRFDNRDVGLSTKFAAADDFDLSTEIMKLMSGESVTVPYHLSDMAADAMGLLDHLGINRAHVVGASMGGMIAQQIAIDFPDRVLSLTSIMSTTGDPDVGQATPEVLPILMQPAPSDRDAFIAQAVESSRLISSPDHFDESVAVKRVGESYDRCFYPQGIINQILAIATSGSRSAGLRKLTINALVIHGEVDPLIPLSGGERTAEVIPSAELIVFEGMGHDLPPFFWPATIEAITSLAARTSAVA
ncbi:MAG: alpha/beta hydrolase [Actinomycetes bacterium]